MKSVSSSDMKQSLGNVLATAAREPVTITRHGTPRYVLMSTDEYDRHRAPFPRVYSVKDTPDDLADMILAALDKSLSEPS